MSMLYIALGSILCGLLSNELYVLLPWLARMVVRLAARIDADHPDEIDDIYAEHIDGIETLPGRLTKLIAACGLLFKVAIARRVRGAEAIWRRFRRIAEQPGRQKYARIIWLWVIVAGVVLPAVSGAALAVTRQSSPTRIIQFHYEFVVPDGWEQIGSNTEFRETDLRPVGVTGTADKILVKETELSYDSTSQRDRAVNQLHNDYERSRSRSGPPQFEGFDDDATFAGRNVVYYIERASAGTVDWYVVFQGRYQVSVGCQRGGELVVERVTAACTGVVHSLIVHS